MDRTGKQRPHKPTELGPRLFLRGRWYGADLRPWGGARITLRNPNAKGWPEAGERTENPEFAAEWAWAYVNLLKREEHDRIIGKKPALAAPTLEEAKEPYLMRREKHERLAPGTIHTDRTGINVLIEAFGPKRRLDKITHQDLQGLIDRLTEEGYSAKTIESYRHSISAFLQRHLPDNPTVGLKLPEVEDSDAHAWSDEELEQIRQACDSLDRKDPVFPSRRLCMELALATGARVQELFALRWEQINRRHYTIRLVEQFDRHYSSTRQLKSGSARTALILPNWWAFDREGERGLILCQKDGTRCPAYLMERICKYTLLEAGVYQPRRGWHTFRHTYGRLFLEDGGRMEELQKSLGHASITTTEKVYGHFHEDVAATLARTRIYRTWNEKPSNRNLKVVG